MPKKLKDLEIEKKFLVTSNDYLNVAWVLRIYDGISMKTKNVHHIIQGYLSSIPERTVRIRIQDEIAFLTIKGLSVGAIRYEWETEIDIKDAENLLKICEPGIIDKYRYEIEVGNPNDGYYTYEVDKFIGENEGLIIAEIELSDENEEFPKPSWLGEEVTGVEKYYNSNLMKNPYTKWVDNI